MKEMMEKIGNLICKILTRYFQVFCPKERKLRCRGEEDASEIERYYLSKTRW